MAFMEHGRRVHLFTGDELKGERKRRVDGTEIVETGRKFIKGSWTATTNIHGFPREKSRVDVNDESFHFIRHSDATTLPFRIIPRTPFASFSHSAVIVCCFLVNLFVSHDWTNIIVQRFGNNEGGDVIELQG